MLQMCRHTIVKHKLNDNFTLCLPCDAVTVLMVIACDLIYAIRYYICTYKLLLPSTCTFYIIFASIYSIHMQCMACELNICF